MPTLTTSDIEVVEEVVDMLDIRLMVDIGVW